MSCDGGEDVSAVERSGWAGEPVSGLIEVASFRFVCRQDEGEEAVVGA